MAAGVLLRINAIFSLVDLDAVKAPALSDEDGDFLRREVVANGNGIVPVQVFSEAAKASLVRFCYSDNFRELFDGLIEVVGLVRRDFESVILYIARN